MPFFASAFALIFLLQLTTGCSSGSSSSGFPFGDSWGPMESECIDRNPELAGAIKFGKAACVKKAIEAGQSANEPTGGRFDEPRLPLELALDSSAVFFAGHKPGVVQTLLNAGADPNKRFSNGSTALAVALNSNERGYPEIAAALIAFPATQINSADPTSSVQPLIKAIDSKNQMALNALLARPDLDVHIQQGGQAATYRALASRQIEITQALLARGASPNGGQSNGDCLLLAALRFQEEALVQQLLNHPQIELNRVGPGGETALHLAVQRETDTLALQLMSKGADVRATLRNGTTVLHFVKSAALAETLISRGAQVGATDASGRTPLIAAVDRSLSALVRVLLARGGNANDSVRAGNTVLFTALTKGDHESVDALIASGADVRRLNTEGSTTLIAALASGNSQDALVVLNAGADPKVEDQKGRLALSLAAARGLTDVAQEILRKGASVNAPNRSRRTALHDAGSTSMVELLIKAGAQVNALDHDGESALSSQVAGGRADLVQILIDRGADQKWRSAEGQGLLTVAIANESLAVAELLIQRGADVNGADSKTRPLFAARTRAALELLVKHGVDLNDRRTPVLNHFFQRYLNFPTHEAADLVGALYKLGARSTSVLTMVFSEDAVPLLRALLRNGYSLVEISPLTRQPYYFEARSVSMVLLLVEAKADLQSYRPVLTAKVQRATEEVVRCQAAYDEAKKRAGGGSAERKKLQEAQETLGEFQQMLDIVHVS